MAKLDVLEEKLPPTPTGPLDETLVITKFRISSHHKCRS